MNQITNTPDLDKINNILPLQATSAEIYDSKYNLKNGVTAEPIDGNTEGTYMRVAMSLARIEVDTQLKSGECKKSDEDKRLRAITAEYYNAMRYGGCWPAGRIMSNAGAGEHKRKTST